MAPRYTFPTGSADIKTLIDRHASENAGLGYDHFRLFRERGVNTANLARIFAKSWKTIRDWEARDDKENGRPLAERQPS